MIDIVADGMQAGTTVVRLFRLDIGAQLDGFESLALTQAEFDAVRTPTATGWRHFLRLQGLEEVQGDFDLKGAAEMLAQLKWTPAEFAEHLEAAQNEVGKSPVLSLPVVYRRLLSLVSRRKDAL